MITFPTPINDSTPLNDLPVGSLVVSATTGAVWRRTERRIPSTNAKERVWSADTVGLPLSVDANIHSYQESDLHLVWFPHE
jgi:hypothetical protein